MSVIYVICCLEMEFSDEVDIYIFFMLKMVLVQFFYTLGRFVSKCPLYMLSVALKKLFLWSFPARYIFFMLRVVLFPLFSPLDGSGVNVNVNRNFRCSINLTLDFLRVVHLHMHCLLIVKYFSIKSVKIFSKLSWNGFSISFYSRMGI